METFLEMVIDELERFTQRVDIVEQLQRDIAITAGIAGAMAAGRCHDDAKIRYLANAVAQTVLDSTWDAKPDFAVVLLRLVDELTATHIHLLSCMRQILDDWHVECHVEDGRAAGCTIYFKFDFVANRFAEQEPGVILGMLTDLMARNLLDNSAISAGQTTTPPEPTPLGQALLDFVQRPGIG